VHEAPREEGLPKRERLLKRHEFLRVQRRGRRFKTHLFVLIWHPGPAPWARLGVTASKRVGRAVVRTRAKRLIREAFRRNKSLFPEATDIVFLASSRIATASYDDVVAQVERWAKHRETIS